MQQSHQASIFLGLENIEITGIIQGADVDLEDIHLEYAVDNKNTRTGSNTEPLTWLTAEQVSYDVQAGIVSGIANITGIVEKQLYIRLKAETLAGVIYDQVSVTVSLLDEFKILEPDFDKYGYKEDLFIGERNGFLSLLFIS